MNLLASLVLAGAMTAGGALGILVAQRAPAPRERKITIHARQYAYDPEIIRVNRGDRIHIKLISKDVMHGFYLEGYGINARVAPLSTEILLKSGGENGKTGPVEEIVFTATKTGKFRYRCSQTCGFLHPFMLGELVVSPNRLYPAGSGMVLGLLLGMTILSCRKGAGA